MAVERYVFQMDATGNAVPEMKKVQGQLQQIDRTMNRTTSRMRAQTGGLTRMTRGFGLLGLQVQDVAVQASMGTDAMRIFSMQGPQILSLFGPLGMIAGAVAGVGAGILMANGAASDFSFDFKKFATDMAPLLDAIRPAIEAIGSAFRFIGGLAVDAFNGLLNGARMAGVVISHLPAVVTEAFSRIGTRIQLMRIAFDRLGLSIQISFAEAMRKIVEASVNAVNNMAEALNNIPFFNMPTDIGGGVLDRMTITIAGMRSEVEGLNADAQTLRDALAQPNSALAAMREELLSITGIDIRDYFGQAAAALGEGGEGGGGGLTGAAKEAADRMKDLGNSISSSMEDAFMSIADGTKSAKDAFKSMAKSIIAELYRVLVVQRTVAAITGALGGAGTAGGFLSQLFPARAQGGAVSANRPYVVGEKGPEMLVPSTSGRVIPNNQLGGGGSGQQVVINYSFQGGVTEADLGRALPLLVERTKREVVEAVQRGGSVARVFR